MRSAACALLVAACASYAEPVKNADTLQELGFLQPGITARDEIVARLGTPSQNYENGRIVSYDVYRTPEGRLTVTPAAGKGATGEIFRGHRYTLILVFASDGTLDRENLFDKHE
ncbi:MAG TPA: hypothetical protein VMU06_08585 [Stellaceae bacterium]|nr:hypothetical protein [Stellaceae bacterium]